MNDMAATMFNLRPNFPIPMLLVKAFKTSNASRAIITPKTTFLPLRLPLKLKISLKSNSGRSANGRLVCYTKKSKKNLRCLPKTSYNLRNFSAGFLLSLN
jgi:hypothetical protein